MDLSVEKQKCGLSRAPFSTVCCLQQLAFDEGDKYTLATESIH